MIPIAVIRLSRSIPNQVADRLARAARQMLLEDEDKTKIQGDLMCGFLTRSERAEVLGSLAGPCFDVEASFDVEGMSGSFTGTFMLTRAAMEMDFGDEIMCQVPLFMEVKRRPDRQYN